jgi:hypothetical protein
MLAMKRYFRSAVINIVDGCAPDAIPLPTCELAPDDSLRVNVVIIWSPVVATQTIPVPVSAFLVLEQLLKSNREVAARASAQPDFMRILVSISD